MVKTDNGKIAEQPNTVAVKDNFTTMAQLNRALTMEQRKVIKDTLAPSLDDSELMLFLYKAHKLKLDPLNQEIFAYSSGSPRKLVMIVARDGKRVIAERTGKLEWIQTEAIYRRKVEVETVHDGKKEIVIKYQIAEPWEGGELWGARCTIKRKDIATPITVTVPLSEYKGSSPVWINKPETMIKKVAESQAYSASFPEMSGVYDEAERWDEPSAPVAIEGGDEPATEAQKETIRALMGGNTKGVDFAKLNKQEAVVLIKSMSKEAGRKMK